MGPGSCPACARMRQHINPERAGQVRRRLHLAAPAVHFGGQLGEGAAALFRDALERAPERRFERDAGAMPCDRDRVLLEAMVGGSHGRALFSVANGNSWMVGPSPTMTL